MRACLVLLLMCLGGLAWSSSALAFGNCTSDAYVRSFDARLSGTTCTVKVETEIAWAGGRQPLRMVVSAENADEPSLEYLVTPIRSLAERVGRAMTAMGGVEIAPTTIFVTGLQPPADPSDPALVTSAITRPFPDENECEVVFYWDNALTNYDNLMFDLAHELFHCISAKSFLDVYNHESAAWWAEGSAEYFAHLAYPGTSRSDSWVAEFDAGSPTRPLWEFAYSSVPFFFWLGQNEGPSRVANFVHGMAVGEGPAAEQAALQRMVTPAEWKRFGEDYLDRRIQQPGGRPMASTPRGGRLTRIGGSTSFSVATQPFVLHRERLLFASGKVYQLRQNHIDPGVSVVFSTSAGLWIPPPDRVLACRDPVAYRVLATSTSMEGGADYEVLHRPGQDTEGACCMVGEWTPTRESIHGEVSALFEGAWQGGTTGDVALSCDAPMGGWQLDFREDGTGSLHWQGFGNVCTASAPGGEMVTTSVRDGTTDFEWQSTAAGAGLIRYTGHEVKFAIKSRLGTITIMDRVAPYPGPRVESNGLAYQCTATTLNIQGIFGLNYHEGTHTRVTPPP